MLRRKHQYVITVRPLTASLMTSLMMPLPRLPSLVCACPARM